MNCFVLRSYPFKDNVYTILLPTVGCFAPLPPPLNATLSPFFFSDKVKDGSHGNAYAMLMSTNKGQTAWVIWLCACVR